MFFSKTALVSFLQSGGIRFHTFAPIIEKELFKISRFAFLFFVIIIIRIMPSNVLVNLIH